MAWRAAKKPLLEYAKSTWSSAGVLERQGLWVYLQRAELRCVESTQGAEDSLGIVPNEHAVQRRARVAVWSAVEVSAARCSKNQW